MEISQKSEQRGIGTSATSSTVPITVILGVYNEEKRISNVLSHATIWADEVVVFNKASTDSTKNICTRFGPKVKVVDIPFSPKGSGDLLDILKYVSNDWVFSTTASEIPTLNIIEHLKQVLAERESQLDVIYVPRKIYSFGIHSELSPFSVSYYPFVYNKHRALISNVIHKNISARDATRTYTIPFSDDCCVYHLTHSTAKQYILDILDYFQVEAACCTDPEAMIKECFDNIVQHHDLFQKGGFELLGHACAWQIYWLGTALFIWENQRGIDVRLLYQQMREDIMEKEWRLKIKQNEPKFLSPASPVQLLWDVARSVKSEDDLLYALKGQDVCYTIKTLYVIGAHRFQEKDLLDEIFPNLSNIYLFEPLPDFYQLLTKSTQDDPRVQVFPYAIADVSGTSDFFVTNNDAASSSLLHLGKHQELFPHVKETSCISVACRTIDDVIIEHSLNAPDMLFIDVQGAEYRILSSISPFVRSAVKLIYTEASTEAVYKDARPLEDICHLLTPEYCFLGFAPLTNATPTHGNALFVNQHNSGDIATVTQFCGATYKVSAIVSTYNAEAFIRGCLEDLVEQSLYKKGMLEVIVVDSGSVQSEAEIVKEFQANYAHIRYIRTDRRETVYQAWNRGIGAARGEYITNANTDDRHRFDALEIMSASLDAKPDVALVYADSAVTYEKNMAFDTSTVVGHFRWPAFNPVTLFQTCYVGPQPLWRKSLHVKHGMFEGGFSSAGDYDFWLRLVAGGEKFLHIDDTMGLYLLSHEGVEHSDNGVSRKESQLARLRNWPIAWGECPEEGISYLALLEKEVPLVSVIIPTCNRSSMLLEAVASVRAQTFHKFEIIVVNDGGEDVSGLLASFKDDRITCLQLPVRVGRSAARNAGIRAARGRYISYLDDDDIYYPDHLFTLLSFMQQSGIRAAYSDASCARQQLKAGRYVTVERKVVYADEFDREALHCANYIPILCMVHEKGCLDQAGMFDEELETHEDWDLWIRISRYYELKRVARVTCEYRVRDDLTNTTTAKKPVFIASQKQLYQRYATELRYQETTLKQRSCLFGQLYSMYQDLGQRLDAICGWGELDVMPDDLLRRLGEESGAVWHQMTSAWLWRRSCHAGSLSERMRFLRYAIAADAENAVATMEYAQLLYQAGGDASKVQAALGALLSLNPLDAEAEAIYRKCSQAKDLSSDARKLRYIHPM